MAGLFIHMYLAFFPEHTIINLPHKFICLSIWGKCFYPLVKTRSPILAFPRWIVKLVWRKQEFAFFVRSFGCALFTGGEMVGFRFRKSVNLDGGLKINFSKSGVGYSWGTKGARITKMAKGGTRTTLSIPGTGISYVKESNKKKLKQSSRAAQLIQQSNNVERKFPMKWIDFILCFFLGVFGVHKFREKKIGIGILYLLTCGLLGLGWLYDCARYLIIAIKSDDAPSLEPSTSESEYDNPVLFDDVGCSSKPFDSFKKNLRWILVAILALFVFAGFPSISALLALAVIALVIPIPRWEIFVEKQIKGKTKSLVAVVMAVLAFFSFPATPKPGTSNDLNSSSAIVTDATDPIHIHDFVDATCLAPQTCADCGETNGEALGHTWIDATCLSQKTCSVCGVAEGEIADHSWEAPSCLIPQTCSVCHIIEGELADHSWVDATCLAPKICAVCQITEGELSAHSWSDATCIVPKTCSVCNVTKGDTTKHTWEDATCLTPQTCSVCKTTKGERGLHKWEKATCQAPKTCSVCGEKDGYATDCKYKNGICIYCEDVESTVWIPRTGSKYHTHSGCSNMDNPSEVPISKAISRGFTPCKRCY